MLLELLRGSPLFGVVARQGWDLIKSKPSKLQLLNVSLTSINHNDNTCNPYLLSSRFPHSKQGSESCSLNLMCLFSRWQFCWNLNLNRKTFILQFQWSFDGSPEWFIVSRRVTISSMQASPVWRIKPCTHAKCKCDHQWNVYSCSWTPHSLFQQLESIIKWKKFLLLQVWIIQCYIFFH